MDAHSLAAAIAAQYSVFPQVEAVAWGGSHTSAAADAASDIDLYVYLRSPLPPAQRAAFIRARSRYAEIDNQVWEPGDEWIEAESGTKIDAMYRELRWIESQLDRVLVHHQASAGYSTAFWYNVRTSQLVFDRNGWFAKLQAQAQQPYPEPLRRAIIAKNYPLLRTALWSYRQQIGLAVARGDLISINHRVAALLASYFDVLFALNRLPHPGEKRLIAYAARDCKLLPHNMALQVKSLIGASAQASDAVLDCVDALADNLDDLLREQGVLPSQSTS